MEVQFLFTAVDALDDMISLSVVVQHKQTGQFTVQMLTQTMTNSL